MITMDGTGLTRCAECDTDLNNLQKHLIDNHGFPNAAIQEIGMIKVINRSSSSSSSSNGSKLKHKKKDRYHQLTLTTL